MTFKGRFLECRFGQRSRSIRRFINQGHDFILLSNGDFWPQHSTNYYYNDENHDNVIVFKFTADWRGPGAVPNVMRLANDSREEHHNVIHPPSA